MTAMNVSIMKYALTDAPSATVTNWDRIVWPTVEQFVNRLQRRIAKVTLIKAGWPDQFNTWSLKGSSRVRGNSHARFLGE